MDASFGRLSVSHFAKIDKLSEVYDRVKKRLL